MARIPVDVDRPDKVLFGLTVRQAAILAGTGAIVWGGWQATAALLPGWLIGAAAVPVLVIGAALAMLRRDGIGLDELARAGFAFRVGPRRLSGAAPAGGEPLPAWLTQRAHPQPNARAGGGADAGMGGAWGTQVGGGRSGRLGLAARGVHEHGWGGTGVGIIDLGAHGVAVVAAVSTVNLALRTEDEQHGLVACFARLLAALSVPAQIVVRSAPLDLSPALADLDHAAATLGHPALRAAAAGQRAHLGEIAATGPLVRQVFLVLRDPTPLLHDRHAAAAGMTAGVGGWAERGGPRRAGAVNRLLGLLGEAQRCLAPAEITVRPLDPAATTAVLAAAATPDRPLTARSTQVPTGPPRSATRYLPPTPGDGEEQPWAG